MDNITLIGHAIACLIAVLFLWRYTGINLTLSSVMLMLLLLLHGPAYFYYVLKWGPESGYLDSVLSAARGGPVLDNVSIALSIVFLAVCAGIVLADATAGARPLAMRRRVREWRADRFLVTAEDKRLARHLMWIFLVPMLAFAIADNQLNNVFSYFGSFATESEKLELRREFGGSSIYLYNLLSSNVVPFVAFSALAIALLANFRSKLLLILFITLVMISRLALLSKGPFAVLLIQLLVVFTMTRRLQLGFGALVKILVVTCAMFVLMVYAVNLGQGTSDLIFDILVYRTLMIPNEAIIEYFSAIPYVLDFSWGRQFSWIAGLFQTNPQLPTYLLVGEVHRGFLGSTTTAMFVADAWADFAWAGVVVMPLFAGWLIRTIDLKLIYQDRPTVWRLGALAMGHFGLYVSMNTSFTTAMLTGGLLFTIPLANWLPRWSRRLTVRRASPTHLPKSPAQRIA